MADRQAGTDQPQRPPPYPTSAAPHRGVPFLARIYEHSQNSPKLFGFLMLAISGAILLLLTGATITVAVLGLVFFSPLIIITSPIWVPVGFVLLAVVAGFFAVCGSGLAVTALVSWLYRYLRGYQPAGTDSFEYARSRIAGTASQVKDYAREYGGYLQSKVKDAAPGA